MTSILKVDTIQDTAGNNIINESGDTITIGASGDTVTIPSGATTTLTDGVSGDFKMNSGYGSIATAYGCRAWVNFDGTGTVAIRASGNVSSITDNGTGDYTVNFTTAMPDANYSLNGNNGDTDNANSTIYSIRFPNGATPTTTAATFRSHRSTGGTASVTDEGYITITVHR
jgi:hypothetical protein